MDGGDDAMGTRPGAGWYVAVGVPLGRWLDATDPQARAGAVIRRGDRFAVVGLEALGVFLAALTPRRWSDLVTAAGEAGVGRPAALVDSLWRDGLLVHFDEDEQANFAALAGLRLHTVGVGLGNDSGDDPQRFVIGDHRLRPLLRCDGLTYTVWASSDGRTLGEIAGTLARGYSTTAERILLHILHTLPELLSARVAFLDTAPTRRSSNV
jgi:hypothetical protein